MANIGVPYGQWNKTIEKKGNITTIIYNRPIKAKRQINENPINLFQSRHFRKLIPAIKGTTTRAQLIDNLVKMFESDNVRFNKKGFIEDVK